jgi:hypothetical protein
MLVFRLLLLPLVDRVHDEFNWGKVQEMEGVATQCESRPGFRCGVGFVLN